MFCFILFPFPREEHVFFSAFPCDDDGDDGHDDNDDDDDADDDDDDDDGDEWTINIDIGETLGYASDTQVALYICLCC